MSLQRLADDENVSYVTNLLRKEPLNDKFNHKLKKIHEKHNLSMISTK